MWLFGRFFFACVCVPLAFWGQPPPAPSNLVIPSIGIMWPQNKYFKKCTFLFLAQSSIKRSLKATQTSEWKKQSVPKGVRLNYTSHTPEKPSCHSKNIIIALMSCEYCLYSTEFPHSVPKTRHEILKNIGSSQTALKRESRRSNVQKWILTLHWNALRKVSIDREDSKVVMAMVFHVVLGRHTTLESWQPELTLEIPQYAWLNTFITFVPVMFLTKITKKPRKDGNGAE